MKTFREFIFDCYNHNYTSVQDLILESKTRGGPDYDYEQSFVNLYNHMVNKSDSEGAEMRELFRSAVQRRDVFTITDLIAKEVQRSQTDPTSPLYFDNLDPKDPGFTGGKRSKSSGEVEDKEGHRQAYYDKLLNQQYSLLNFVQSKSGRIQAARGHIAEREGATKIPLTAKAREITGKKQDTSKVDVSFVDENGRKYGISLKDAKGAVVNSSGAEETKAYILLGINSLLDQQEQSGEITPEQRAEKEAMGKELAVQLALYMAGTRGMSKEQQKDALPQMQEYINSIESVIPGTIQAMSAEAITGKGKYGDASTVDALFSTGRGGEVIEDPSWLAQYIFQRGRLGKGTTKTKEGAIQRPTTMSGDIKNYHDAENKPTESDYLDKWNNDWGLPAWQKKIATFEPEFQDEVKRLQDLGQFDLRYLADIEKADVMQKQIKASENQVNQSQNQLSQAEEELAKANNEAEEASVPIDPDTKKPVLRQFIKNIEGHIAADPTSRTSRVNLERRTRAELRLSNAQTSRDNAAATYDTNVQQVQAVQAPAPQQAPEQPQQASQQPPQQQQQAPEQPQQASQQPPQQQQQAPEQPQQPQQAPTQQPTPQQAPVEQPPASQEPQQEKPEDKKPKKGLQGLLKRMDTAATRNNLEQ
jgi:hypothetical protein